MFVFERSLPFQPFNQRIVGTAHFGPTASFPSSPNVLPSQVLITERCVTPTFEKYAPYTKCLALAEWKNGIIRSFVQYLLLSRKHAQKAPRVVQRFALA